MTDLPKPPYPATIVVRARGEDVVLPLRPEDVDLRHFGRMPLDVGRLLGSDFYMRAPDRAFKAGVTLWCRSWHQVPCGSVPADDRSLAHLAGLGGDVRAWRRVSKEVLDGFVKCSDGRLYHPVICEIALSSYRASRKQSANAYGGQVPDNAQNDLSHGNGDDGGSGSGDGIGLATPRGEGRGIEGSKDKKPSSGARPKDGAGKPSPDAGKGSRLPEDFQPDLDLLAWASSKGFTEATLDAARDEFVDYWRAVPGAKGRKLDWQATFRNRLRERGPEGFTPRTRAKPGAPGAVHPDSDLNSFRFALETFRKRGFWNHVGMRSPPPTDPQCRGFWDYPDLMAEFGYPQNTERSA